MDKQLNIVIPMKSPAKAKQRLMGVLTTSQRECLAENLFRQTLRFFANHYSHINRLVVTDSTAIADIARLYGAKVLLESKSKGLNHAVRAATGWSKKHGFCSQLILPADVAELDVAEVEQLISASQNDYQVVVALAKDCGTNALLTSPPDVIDFHYGQQSSLAHIQQAHINGLSVEVLKLSKLSQDIDVPDDLLYVYPAYQQKREAEGVLL